MLCHITHELGLEMVRQGEPFSTNVVQLKLAIAAALLVLYFLIPKLQKLLTFNSDKRFMPSLSVRPILYTRSIRSRTYLLVQPMIFNSLVFRVSPMMYKLLPTLDTLSRTSFTSSNSAAALLISKISFCICWGCVGIVTCSSWEDISSDDTLRGSRGGTCNERGGGPCGGQR